MKLTYIYHSGFVIEGNGCSVLIDYFKDTDDRAERGFVHEYLLKRPERLYVLASHFHADHFNREVLQWKDQKKEIVYLFSKDILKRKRAGKADAAYLQKGDCFEDECIHVEAFGSTDSGISFLIRMQGTTIFHAGDLNNWHWTDESTAEEAAEAEQAYLKELSDLSKRTKQIDLAMFPVDPRIGSDFGRGAIQFVARIPTRRFVPMHFWERPDEIRSFITTDLSESCQVALLAVPGESLVF